MSEKELGWWFSKEDVLPNDDGRPIAVGETHEIEIPPPLMLCRRGLHFASSVLEALVYAPGNILWRVEVSGEILRDVDKGCAQRRTYLARLDAEAILWEFARWCARSLLHLWNAPQVVRDYLISGDESLRAAAWAAAEDAAWAAAWAAARDAAWAAAKAAAWAAAEQAQRGWLENRCLKAVGGVEVA